jgi:hypothetical protein
MGHVIACSVKGEMTMERAAPPVLSAAEIAQLPRADEEHTLWERKIVLDVGGTRCEGMLKLIQQHVHQHKPPTFRMQADITKPIAVTGQDGVGGNGVHRFAVVIVPCWRNVTEWRQTATDISFHYDIQALWGSWHVVYQGPVSGKIVSPTVVAPA